MCQCISAFAKYLLFAVNVLTFLTGVAFVVVGSLFINDRSFVSNLLSNKSEAVDTQRLASTDEIKSELDVLFHTAGGIVLCVGAFIVLLSILGFVGLVKNSKCLLMLYVLVITILNLAANSCYCVSSCLPGEPSETHDRVFE